MPTRRKKPQTKQPPASLPIAIDFRKLGRVAGDVVPVVVQDANTLEVLVLAYMNEEALRATLEMGNLVLWSTSRNELWVKGATSGNTFAVAGVRVNCENNSLLVFVEPQGKGMCHKNDPKGVPYRSCFYRDVTTEGETILATVRNGA
jgi:phosphoribosyl-AMP cyclohydrolase